ncbi:hypothetical protein [Actinoplanes friuliensis]|uniref:hypothetical protein n=1 Tax=Actinoplanes friuliensis TaxID=196914 RepID=UPI0005A25DE3|nr:hypothetical protein [Actinoplanes friuliensis]
MRARRILRRATAVLALAVLALAAAVNPAAAAGDDDSYWFQLLAKAQADECFNGIGLPYPAGPPCAEGQPKVNQAYVWGLTRIGSHVWFGTGAQPNCLTSGATLDVLKPTVNDNYVCEYGESQTVKNDPTWPAEIGDQRPPEVWLYDARTQRSVNKSREISARSAADAERLRTTIGLRAAGNLDGVVLLGGPALNDSMNLFAFDNRTRRFLGSATLTAYGNIRTFLQAEGGLYLGVGVGTNGISGGAVLRWTGSRRAPFTFDQVATLPVQAADLTYHDGRIATTSWPAEQPTTVDRLAGVWISPVLADGAPGLTTEDATGWKQVWHARLYETDRVVAATYGGGGVASFGGYLYWGTMHVPMKATKVHQSVYPQTTDEAKVNQVVNTQRGISIWRGKDLGLPTQQIDLLYGETELPTYDPATATWSKVSTGRTPLYGKSGFGYPFNNYTWRMAVAGGRLYVGTMDWSYIAQDLLAQGSGFTTADRSGVGASAIDPAAFGGDLWMFPSASEPAQQVSITGLGNYLNYGIRNMVPDGDDLYVGMANPMNLRTDPTDDVPEGGWELIKLTAPSS